MLQDELSLLSASCQNDEAAAKEMEQELVGLKEVMDEAKRAYNTANTTWKRAQDKDMQDGDAGADLANSCLADTCFIVEHPVCVFYH